IITFNSPAPGEKTKNAFNSLTTKPKAIHYVNENDFVPLSGGSHNIGYLNRRIIPKDAKNETLKNRLKKTKNKIKKILKAHSICTLSEPFEIKENNHSLDEINNLTKNIFSKMSWRKPIEASRRFLGSAVQIIQMVV
ncbi:MAG: hypothetical protein WCT85_04315, partial [Parachlamydiales bacterium]